MFDIKTDEQEIRRIVKDEFNKLPSKKAKDVMYNVSQNSNELEEVMTELLEHMVAAGKVLRRINVSYGSVELITNGKNRPINIRIYKDTMCKILSCTNSKQLTFNEFNCKVQRTLGIVYSQDGYGTKYVKE